jgi:hypothetical protein
MFRTLSTAGRVRAAVLLSAAVLGASACSSDPSTSPSSKSQNIVGTYNLQQVDDEAVPVVIHDGLYYDAINNHLYLLLVVTVSGGGIELDEAGNIDVWFDVDVWGDGAIWRRHIEVQGTYTANGSQVTAYAGGQAMGTFSVVKGEIVDQADLLQEGVTKEYRFRR